MNTIIHVSGRSGTTLFNKMFSYHPRFKLIFSWLNKYPNQDWFSNFNAIYHDQYFGIKWIMTKYIPKPSETYGFWTFYFEPFSSKANLEDLVNAKKVGELIESIKKKTSKPHFVTKLTGEARKEILDEVFEKDYLVLWIERDPRVVVSSYMKQKWFYKNKPEEYEKLTMTEKIEFYSKFYKDNFYGAKTLNRKVLKYEDLCHNPLDFFEKLFQELNLNFHKKHKQIIKSWDVKSVNWENYAKKYTNEEIELFNTLLKDELLELDYNI